MLKLFKKAGRSNSSASDEKPVDQINKRHSMPLSASSTSLCNKSLLDENFTDDGIEAESFESRSRLSMNLHEILSDKNCLSFFVQFLETRNALSLIKFYLDTKSFEIACEHQPESVMQTSTSLKTLSTNADMDTISLESQSGTQYSLRSNQSQNSLEELEDNSPVPELKTLCDLSMRKPLTDDEKSQIYAETNKRKLKTSKSANARISSMAAPIAERPRREPSSSLIATDAIRIFRKYLSSNSQYFIDIPATIHSQISLALCAQEDGSLSISPDSFNEAQKFVIKRLENENLNDFLASTFYCKYCIDILSSPGLKLRDILHSESALFYFMEYLEQENQRDCLEFWLAAMNFRKHYESIEMNEQAVKEAQDDSMILYEKYFSLQAVTPLRISDHVRSVIEENICSDDKAKQISRCFDLPLRIIENYIEEKYFASFCSSQLFGNYLNELRSKIPDQHATNSVKRMGHRKTMSDCTSESTTRVRSAFISQQNTLLAMESSRMKGTTQSSDMQIDSRQLTNPDLLWHRNSVGGLTFGRVDALGRYERDFDMETIESKWSFSTGGNKFKNAVRKLVNLPEDKVQEEIAWQVAEMIIKDVTSVTLGDKGDGHDLASPDEL